MIPGPGESHLFKKEKMIYTSWYADLGWVNSPELTLHTQFLLTILIKKLDHLFSLND
jgi:hypothetical protein